MDAASRVAQVADDSARPALDVPLAPEDVVVKEPLRLLGVRELLCCRPSYQHHPVLVAGLEASPLLSEVLDLLLVLGIEPQPLWNFAAAQETA